jgi:hypothetical protein
MREITPSEAIGALKDAFGPTLETTRERGLRLMRDTLAEAFDITGDEADDVLTALEHGQSLTWVETTAGAAGPPSTAPFAETSPMSAPQNAPFRLPIEGGYWRIGEGG